MSKVPVEEIERNLEFYKRWRINHEDIYTLIREYGFSYPRAYQIKAKVERDPKYQEKLGQL